MARIGLTLTGGAGYGTLKMTGATSHQTYSVSASAGGQRFGYVVGDFIDGETVTFQAIPASGSVFSGWSGLVSGTALTVSATARDGDVYGIFNLPIIPPPPPGAVVLTILGSATVTAGSGSISFSARKLVPNYIMSFARDKWCGSGNAEKSYAGVLLDGKGFAGPFPVDGLGNVYGTIKIPYGMPVGQHYMTLINDYWGNPTGYEEGTGCGVYVNSLIRVNSNAVIITVVEGVPLPTAKVTFNGNRNTLLYLGNIKFMPGQHLYEGMTDEVGLLAGVIPDGQTVTLPIDSYLIWLNGRTAPIPKGFQDYATSGGVSVYAYNRVPSVPTQAGISVTGDGTISLVFAPTQKTVTANLTVTGFPTPTATVTLLIDGASQTPQTITSTQLEGMNNQAQVAWQVDAGHRVKVQVHLENPLGTKDIDSQEVQV